MEKNETHKIEKIMQDAMTKIKDIIDVNTVIGNPITSIDGTIIIPITKVSVGFVAGGGEYNQTTEKTQKEYPFAGGSGTGFCVMPIGFLVGNKNSIKFIGTDSKNSFGEIVKIVAELTKKIMDK
jgi:sporulation protein YtfJ